jgi:phage baseplate assembly protein W
VSRNNLYSDIPNNFIVHPVLKDITPIKDLDSVKQSLKNLLLSSRTSRPFQPELSGGINELLFEQVDAFTAYELQTRIERIIQQHEPRIDVFEVFVKDNMDENSYTITIKFNVSYDRTEEIVFYLNRIR